MGVSPYGSYDAIAARRSSRLSVPGSTTCWLSVHAPASFLENTVAPYTRSPTAASSGRSSTTSPSAVFAAAMRVTPLGVFSAIDPEESRTSIIRP